MWTLIFFKLIFSLIFFYPKREYDENEVDPYHGNQEKMPEPEALDLPDDLNLDSEDKNGGEDTDNEEGEGMFRNQLEAISYLS